MSRHVSQTCLHPECNWELEWFIKMWNIIRRHEYSLYTDKLKEELERSLTRKTNCTAVLASTPQRRRDVINDRDDGSR